MDLRFEAAAASELYENTKNDFGFNVPKIYWNQTSKKILCLDRIDGIPIREVENLKSQNIDTKKQIIVGVNKYEDLDEIDPELLEIDPEKVYAQIKSVTTLKSSRNNDQVTQQLNRLKLVAESDDNVMPYIIDCVKNDCTLGEISDSFRSVFGEHDPH